MLPRVGLETILPFLRPNSFFGLSSSRRKKTPAHLDFMGFPRDTPKACFGCTCSQTPAALTSTRQSLHTCSSIINYGLSTMIKGKHVTRKLLTGTKNPRMLLPFHLGTNTDVMSMIAWGNFVQRFSMFRSLTRRVEQWKTDSAMTCCHAAMQVIHCLHCQAPHVMQSVLLGLKFIVVCRNWPMKNMAPIVGGLSRELPL